MTNQNNAAQAAEQNPLTDEYVNAVIQRHGYQSPEAVCARLHQWIGLHGGENGVTLLIYEAHKVLTKLRATVSDERQRDIAAALQDSAYCVGLQRGFMLGNHNDNDGLRQALESRDGYVKTIKDARDARASAPVAGEAEIMAIVRDQCPDFDATHEGPSEDDMISIARTLLARYAAPQASEAVRDAGIAASEEVVLPPLPEALALQPGQLGHTDQTLDYFARAAILADRQHRADEVAYIARLRAALILARDSHGVTLLTDPPQNAWKARGVGDVIRAALSAQPGAQKEQNDA